MLIESAMSFDEEEDYLFELGREPNGFWEIAAFVEDGVVGDVWALAYNRDGSVTWDFLWPEDLKRAKFLLEMTYDNENAESD